MNKCYQCAVCGANYDHFEDAMDCCLVEPPPKRERAETDMRCNCGRVIPKGFAKEPCNRCRLAAPPRREYFQNYYNGHRDLWAERYQKRIGQSRPPAQRQTEGQLS